MAHRVTAQVRVNVYAFLHPMEHARIRRLSRWHRNFCENSALARANKTWTISVPNGECWRCRGYTGQQLQVALNWVHCLVIRMDQFFVDCPRHTANVQIRDLFRWLP